MPKEGVIVERAREAILDINIFQDLVSIKTCYEVLITMLDSLENNEFGIYDAVKKIQSINFKFDPVKIGEYIIKRLLDNDAVKITEEYSDNISPVDFMI